MFTPLSPEELRILNKILFGYIPSKITLRELKLLTLQANKQLRSGLILVNNPAILNRLYLNLTVTEDTGCWLKSEDWTKYRSIKVIGNINKTYPAHRLSYWLMNKDFDQSKFVCHFCDRPNCVNFLHLFQGTPTENIEDYAIKQRLIRLKNVFDKLSR